MFCGGLSEPLVCQSAPSSPLTILSLGGVRQDQRVKLAAFSLYGGVGLGVLVRQQGLAEGSYGLGRPAASNVVDPPKARLVLKHPSEGGECAPVMPMQPFVHRRQRHRAPQRGFKLRFDLADSPNAALTEGVRNFV